MRLLMLVSDAHGSMGGIAQFNRDAIDALCGSAAVDEIVVLPRLVSEEFVPLAKVRYDLAAARGKLAFASHALREAAGGRFDLVICGHVNLMPVAAMAARIGGAKLALVVHGTDVWTRPGSLTAASVRRADLIISVSQMTLERMRRWLPGSKPDTAIVPNTVRLDRFGAGAKDTELVAKYGLAGRRVVMTLGRMAANEQAKGFDQVIEVMPRLLKSAPDLVYLCAGDGNDRPRLEAKARNLGLADAVIFTGRVPEERKADYYRLADAYVMASREEGFGIVVLEALACGVPVVGSKIDATREALLEGELGQTVDPNNSTELEQAILKAIDQPKGVPERLSYFGFANFEQRLRTALTPVMAA